MVEAGAHTKVLVSGALRRRRLQMAGEPAAGGGQPPPGGHVQEEHPSRAGVERGALGGAHAQQHRGCGRVVLLRQLTVHVRRAQRRQVPCMRRVCRGV